MDNKLTSKEELIIKMEELISNNEGPFSIVVADIDDFKNLNNLYGNTIGDEVIKSLFQF